METTKNSEKSNKKQELLDKYSDILTRMAIEEINKEIAKKSKLADEIGPSGWAKPVPGRTNKRFLRNTLNNILSHNKRKTNQSEEIRKNFEHLIKRDKESRSNRK